MRGGGLVVLLAGWAACAAAQDTPRNIWAEQYKTRSVDEIAAEFENPKRAVFRYRVAIASLLDLKPGMVVAEIGAGSGFIARLMARQVGSTGRVVATELDLKMVAYITTRARAEGIENVTGTLGNVAATGLDPASVDAIALVETFSYFDRPREMVKSLSETLKPGGIMLIVDSPREGQGSYQTGMDADEVVALVTAAGFQRVDEIGIVPGGYALRFRKP